MAAAKGNKYSQGAGGRPRKTSFSPKEMQELGEEMLAWIDAQDELLHLSQWYTIHKMFTYNEWKTFIQRNEFIPYYEIALKKVGMSYMRKDSPIEPSLKQRWQRVYFKDLKEQEDQDKDDDITRESQMQKGLTKDYDDKLMKVAEQLERIREVKKPKTKKDS
jgi:hypothetical protein